MSSIVIIRVPVVLDGISEIDGVPVWEWFGGGLKSTGVPSVSKDIKDRDYVIKYETHRSRPGWSALRKKPWSVNRVAVDSHGVRLGRASSYHKTAGEAVAAARRRAVKDAALDAAIAKSREEWEAGEAERSRAYAERQAARTAQIKFVTDGIVSRDGKAMAAAAAIRNVNQYLKEYVGQLRSYGSNQQADDVQYAIDVAEEIARLVS